MAGPRLNVTPLAVPGALLKPVADAARGMQELARRMLFEQTPLRRIVQQYAPLQFNVFANLLWRSPTAPDSSQEQQGY